MRKGRGEEIPRHTEGNRQHFYPADANTALRERVYKGVNLPGTRNNPAMSTPLGGGDDGMQRPLFALKRKLLQLGENFAD